MAQTSKLSLTGSRIKETTCEVPLNGILKNVRLIN